MSACWPQCLTSKTISFVHWVSIAKTVEMFTTNCFEILFALCLKIFVIPSDGRSRITTRRTSHFLLHVMPPHHLYNWKLEVGAIQLHYHYLGSKFPLYHRFVNLSNSLPIKWINLKRINQKLINCCFGLTDCLYYNADSIWPTCTLYLYIIEVQSGIDAEDTHSILIWFINCEYSV